MLGTGFRASLKALPGVWHLLGEQRKSNYQHAIGAAHRNGQNVTKKWTRALLFGCLDNGTRKQRTTQTTKPMGWKEERIGKTRQQNWNDSLILTASFNVGGVFHTTSNALNNSWVSCSSTKFWLHLLRDSVRSHQLRVQSTRLLSHQLYIGSHESLLASTNLLVLLTEIFCLPNSFFMIKEYNSGAARMKRCTGQGMWELAGVSIHSLRNFTCSSTQKFYKPCPFGVLRGFITWTWWLKARAIGNWVNLQSLLPPQKSGWDWNFHPSDHRVGPVGNQLPSLGVVQKSPH